MSTQGKQPPKKGERWINKATQQTVRVMSDPIEGWVVARYKDSAPWLRHVNDWHAGFVKKDDRA